MKKNIMSVLFLFFALFLTLAVSSCKEKTPVTVTEKNPQKDADPAFEPIISPDAEKGIIELKSREIPGLEITEPVEIKPGKKVEASAFWLDDFEAAKKKAARENKDLLILFTGSDWCPGCIQMEREVFSKKEFRLEVSKKFVPVMFDFPRRKSLPQQTKEQNEAMHAIYGQPPFPAVYLADRQGRAYTEVGYVPGGVKTYLAQLENLSHLNEQFSELMTAAGKDGLADVEKAKLIEKAVLAINPALLKPFYRDEIKRIISLDKDNEAGLKEKYELPVRMWDAVDLFEGGKPADAIKSLDATIEDMKLTGERLQEVLFIKSRMQFAIQDRDGALKSLNAAVEAGPQTRLAGEIKEVISKYFSDSIPK